MKPICPWGSFLSWECRGPTGLLYGNTTRWTFHIPFRTQLPRNRCILKQKDCKSRGTLPLIHSKGVAFFADHSSEVWSGLGKDWNVWNFALRLFMAAIHWHKRRWLTNHSFWLMTWWRSARTTSGDSQRMGPQNLPIRINPGAWICLSKLSMHNNDSTIMQLVSHMRPTGGR